MVDDGRVSSHTVATESLDILDRRKSEHSELCLEDLQRIWQWNSTTWKPIDVCIHTRFQRAALDSPDALAIDAWDGTFTYAELDQLSTKFAHYLRNNGLVPGMTVIFCFEKSRMISVGLFAAMKAGATCLTLDVTQPKERLLSMTQQLTNVLIASSASNYPLASTLTKSNVIVLDTELLSHLPIPHDPLPDVDPATPLYIVYTSGSTGAPKGVIITHRNFSSAIEYQHLAHGFKGRDSRVLDFASHAFDVSWSNFIHTLICGACLCIPSESERRDDLPGFIKRFQVTHADLTPSMARLLPLETVASLSTLVLGGEALSRADALRWARLTRVVNPYGPCETTPTSVVTDVGFTKDEDYIPGDIGKGLGLNTWLVDPENDQCLVPIGHVGELLLEGPLVGQGYLNDPQKTASAFINDPSWLLAGCRAEYAGRHSRLYKTGDLVRYHEDDGRLIFVGRKDTQVKLNGQRVELEDVESHIWSLVVDRDLISNLAVDVVSLPGIFRPCLACFLVVDAQNATESDQEAHFATIIDKLETQLPAVLPAWMIPSQFIKSRRLPFTATGKLDRNLLRADAKLLKVDQLQGQAQRRPRSPETPLQHELHSLWASILRIDPRGFGITDSFLRLGGDSILAIQLVAAARSRGLEFSVADVFAQPCILELSSGIGKYPIPDMLPVAPFALLGADGDLGRIRSSLAEHCAVHPTLIEDGFPCTPLQTGLLAATLRQADAYIGQFLVQLKPDIDLERFRRAVEAVVFDSPILRTRIIELPSKGLVQAVIREPADWVQNQDISTANFYCEPGRYLQPGLGEPLAKFCLFESRQNAVGHTFGFVLHHALYDGWSTSLMLERIEEAYLGQRPADAVTLPSFIRHLTAINKEDETEYWRSQFASLDIVPFPTLADPQYQPLPLEGYRRHITRLASWSKCNATPSTFLRAAWAIMLAYQTGSRDVVFGATVSGRQAAVPGIENMLAPTIATVPIRVLLEWEDSVSTFLHKIQVQASDMVKYEQCGIPRIRQMSEDAARGCDFQTLLVIQPAEQHFARDSELYHDHLEEIFNKQNDGLGELGTFAITADCAVDSHGLQLSIAFDSNVIESGRVVQLVDTLEVILRQLCAHSEGGIALSQINPITDEDKNTIWEWNKSVPEVVPACIHDLIAARVEKQPDAMAIEAWDGCYTYNQLESLSTKLAHFLCQKGVGPGDIVPLCFEKSKLTPIAMLAVIKTGAACTTMDPSLPPDRLASIVRQVDATTLICSSNQHMAAKKLTERDIIVLDAARMAALVAESNSCQKLPPVDPKSILYLNFTSGSTGEPKGVLITHENFSSAIYYQQAAHGFEPISRVLDFASYAFDVAWSNFVHTLTIGGCLCIPSEDERLNDLTGVMKKFRITHADVTPSTARLLPESTLRQLTTLVLGGEQLHDEDAKRWSALVNVVNPYGPCETTPTASLTRVSPHHPLNGNIGSGLGVNTWVVDTFTGQHLVPVGCPGELFLEGPLVGEGYHGDKEKTEAAFPQDPPWLASPGSGYTSRPARLYRTGDLVRYNPDGTINFIGRKDNQIKIHGQRVDLGDIESHARKCVGLRQCIVVLSPNKQKLIGVVSFDEVDRGESTDRSLEPVDASSVRHHFPRVQAHLRKFLSEYMVPQLFLALRNIPLSPSGKLDRRRVQLWLDGQTGDQFETLFPESRSTNLQEPRTDAERLLRDLCSEVLGEEPSNIDLDRSFIANGGDSISAMRLTSRCRAMHQVITVRQLLQAESIRECVREIQSPLPAVAFASEVYDVCHRLSPIQYWFFTQFTGQDEPRPDQFVNQGFCVRVKVPVSASIMEAALGKIVKHHSILRAQFQRIGEDWMQKLVDVPFDHFESLLLDDLSAVQHRAVARHQSINFERGTVFLSDLCTLLSGEQYLVLYAHHLVVDLVSWRILLEDLEQILQGGQPLPNLAFQVWNELQIEHIEKTHMDPAKMLSTAGVSNDLDYWGFTPSMSNTLADHDTRCVVVDENTTSLVLGNANRPLSSEPIDLLLAAIWHAFLQSCPSRDGLTIFNEGHGREPWDSSIDLSRTVGWFTTMTPIHVPRTAASSAVALVRYLKDSRRLLLDNGWTYFTSRFLTTPGGEAFSHHGCTSEVVFNYQGLFQQFERDAGLFEFVALEDVAEEGLLAPASSLFNIEAAIHNGRVAFDFSYNRHLAHQGVIARWIGAVESSLRTICDELAETAPQRTRCDFEFLTLGYPKLQDLVENIVPGVEAEMGSAVGDIYPCSPTVEGILLSMIRRPESYKTSQIYRIQSSSLAGISVQGLARAWQKVIAHHPSLRAVFIPGQDTVSAFNQAILASYQGDLVFLDSESDSHALTLLNKQAGVDYGRPRPLHRLTLCAVQNSRTVYCRLDMSHAITDGHSTNLILRDWAQAYSGSLSSNNLLTTSRAFARLLIAVDKDATVSYWTEKLAGAEPCHISAIIPSSVREDTVLASSICLDGHVLNAVQVFTRKHSVTAASFVHAIWAVVLSAYVGSSSVCFGYVTAGRDVPVPGIDDAIGAFVNTLVFRVNVAEHRDFQSLLRSVHAQVVKDLVHQQCSLADIQHRLGLPTDLPLFNTLVSYQKISDDPQGHSADGGLKFDELDGEDPTEYGIVLSVNHGTDRLELNLEYKASVLTQNRASRLLECFHEVALRYLDDQTEDLVPTVTNGQWLRATPCASDLQDIWSWNATVPPRIEAAVHDLISGSTLRPSQSCAIDSWDGKYSYSELDAITSRLARHLVRCGVKPKSHVPICCSKSKFAPLAMLSTMKAGAIAVTLDPYQPFERLQGVVQQLCCYLAISTASTSKLTSQVTDKNVLLLNDELVHDLLCEDLESVTLPIVQPDDDIYLVFTSGSSGVPKGVRITHANIASAIQHQRHVLGLTSASRVFDFSSYAFDVVWCNMLHGLSVGATICIPSDQDRKEDFIGRLGQFEADFAIFTPSALRGLDSESLSRMRNLHFIGEALKREDFEQIQNDGIVSNLYGPTECTTFATQASAVHSGQNISIGKGIGCNTWVVDPNDHNRLTPIGCVGELLLEGPLLSPGYLSDDEKTASVFISAPGWMLQGTKGYQGRTSRLYKTGDLVLYRANGDLTYIGRKDAQIKIKGQRVELGEIEHHVKNTMPECDGLQVVVEAVIPKQSSEASLIAFVLSNAGISSDTLDGLESRLAKHLSSHLIPSMLIALESMPLTATGKTDRRELRIRAAAKTMAELQEQNLFRRDFRPPTNPVERQLQASWASVLGAAAATIGLGDDFLRRGGDSISAIRLVSELRSHGLSLTVTEVFNSPKLEEMAHLVQLVTAADQTAITPLSLLRGQFDHEAIINCAAALCGVGGEEVEDILPCTPLQEGLMALTAENPYSHVLREVLAIRTHVDIGRFQKAWDAVIATTAILRTVIVDVPGQGLVQVVLRKAPGWSSGQGPCHFESYMAKEQAATTGLGTRLVRYGLIEKGSSTVFVLAMHHAVYDGWSSSLVLGKLEEAYQHGVATASSPFHGFVQHILNIDQEEESSYWKDYLYDMSAEVYPVLPTATYRPQSDGSEKHEINLSQWPQTGITPSTVIKAAWAVLFQQYTKSTDIVFGVTTSGRQARIAHIDSMIGPTIATVPLRVLIDKEEQVRDLLLRVQAQAIEMTAYEQMGLQKIRKLNTDTERACQFQSLIIIQPAEVDVVGTGELFCPQPVGSDERLAEFDAYAITIECSLQNTGLQVRINFDSNLLPASQAKRMLLQFEKTLHEVCSHSSGHGVVSEIQTVSSKDLSDIWQWNQAVPEAVNISVHKLVAITAEMYQGHVALHAWDGQLTYNELDEYSTRLAIRLISLGVRTGVIVPLCFEKSMWTPVAMVAVMKAGAASVAMDPNQPEERLRSIVQQVGAMAELVLCSVSTQHLAGRLSSLPVAAVGKDLLNGLTVADGSVLPEVDSSALLYLNFTSGSTGVPKGAMVSHRNMSTALVLQKDIQRYGPDSRVYDFASYAFDACWSNLLFTLTSGATLCIPSDSDRKDDLSGSIRRLKVTHADLTPSAARLLPLEIVRGLQTLVVGGERLESSDVTQWKTEVTLINSYGPSECTPNAVFQEINADSPSADEFNSASAIGMAVGVNSWIVEPSTGQSLVPVGCIGELCLEGPIVGLGYLSDPEKTAGAFLENPQFLLTGCPGHHSGRLGRVYRTGDLVYYDSNGSLMFVGRKDMQVKINGQRVELGEIESFMRLYEPVRQAAVLFPKSGQWANRLIGLFSLETGPEEAYRDDSIVLLRDSETSSIQKHVSSLADLVSNALPSHMVPSLWVAVEHLPLNASAKLDKKRLGDWLNSIEPELLGQIADDKINAVGEQPQTPKEKLLCDFCARVLNSAVDKINMRASFIANGGDSISAMRLGSQFREAGFSFSVAAILRSKSLAEFVSRGDVLSPALPAVAHEKEAIDVLFELSPIQTWYFEQFDSGARDPRSAYSTQSFCLELQSLVSAESIRSTVQQLVEHHSMLRARFVREDLRWMQYVSLFGPQCFHFGTVQLEGPSNINDLITKRQLQMDIENGPLFSVDLCHFGGDKKQNLLFVAHHLVIDLVSWSILFDDLQSLITGGSLQSSLPFQIWTTVQREKAQSLSLAPDTSTFEQDLEYWGYNVSDPSSVGDYAAHAVNIGIDTSARLFGSPNSAFGTEPVELILSAVLHAFFRAFPGKKGLAIFNEGHGRESWSSDIDLSRTIGWFTTLSPIYATSERSAASLVRQVKDTKRSAPMNGWAHFASKYSDQRNGHEFDEIMEVVFNYSGQSTELGNTDAPFTNVDLQGVVDDSLNLPMSSLFEFNVFVERGRVQFSINYSSGIKHQQSIVAWFDYIASSVRIICDELDARKPEGTLDDFQHISMDYSSLDNLQHNVLPRIESANNSVFEAVLPCSPMVNGILLSQIQRPESYRTVQQYRVTFRPEGDQVSRLAEAWNLVVARHPALRAVFIPGSNTASMFHQVILQSYQAEVVHLEANNTQSALGELHQQSLVDYSQLRPPHRLTLCKVAEENLVVAQIEMSHAITDGASTALLLQDWKAAYDDSLQPSDLLHTICTFSKLSNTEGQVDYWKTKLGDAAPSQFPRLARTTRIDDKISTFCTSMDFDRDNTEDIQNFCNRHLISPAALFQCAWSLTLSRYTGANKVCFGYLTSGRDSQIAGIDEAIGAFANLLICHTDTAPHVPAYDFLQLMHDQLLEDLDHQHCTLAEVNHALGVSSTGPMFNTLLSYQKVHEENSLAAQETIAFEALDDSDPTEYPIGIDIIHETDSIHLALSSASDYLDPAQATQVLSLMEELIRSMIAPPVSDTITPCTLGELISLSQQDALDIWQWNRDVPLASEVCVHDLISATASRQPHAMAIEAWDGNFSYSELDALSTRIAQYLIQDLGVTPRSIIPVCFEKSRWTPVVMLSVMKAGAGAVALDPALPEDRLSVITTTVQATHILCSAQNFALASRLLGRKAIVIDDSAIAQLPSSTAVLAHADPLGPLYVVFTSGTTGTPKGVVITHINFSSAIKHQQAAHGFLPSSRVFDFASYSFDVSWSNVLHTLSCGGTLCIPSEYERKNELADSLRRYRISHADMTPSTARLVPTSVLESLTTLVLGGEQLQLDDARRWARATTVKNPFGPCECTPTATISTIEPDAKTITIGKGLGLNTWVVDQISGEHLVPIGCIGELLLEGPLVGPGYLDPLKTAEAFVHDPKFLLNGPSSWGRSGRLYRTGDLVRYTPSGDLVFVGRKDTQVKINGQRVELEEIEHHVRQQMPNPEDSMAAVEVLVPKESKKPLLIAFLALAGSPNEHEFADVIDGLDGSLADRLPAYMIPSVYLPLDTLPVTTNGKIDRSRLRAIAGSMTLQQLTAQEVSRSNRRPPTTAEEEHLQRMWAELLEIDSATIGTRDSFLRVGGDSIVAMKLTGTARESGYKLTVADILQNPKLCDMAQRMIPLQGRETPPGKQAAQVYEPFSLLPHDRSEKLVQKAVQMCEVQKSRIADILPTTDEQARYISLTYSAARSMLLYHTLDGDDNIDIERMCEAIQNLVDACDILRTVFIPDGDSFWQVVFQATDARVEVIESDGMSIEECTQSVHRRDMGDKLRIGEPLVQFTLIVDATTQQWRLIARLSHAQHDGISLAEMWTTLEQFYDSGRGLVNRVPTSFGRHIQDISSANADAATEHWRTVLHGAEMTSLTGRTSLCVLDSEGPFLTFTLPQSDLRSSDFTLSTFLRTAWAIVLSNFHRTSDITFGTVTSGRFTLDTHTALGPCVNVVPTRIHVAENGVARALLAAVQADALASLPHEHLGSRTLLRRCTDWPKWGYFTSVIHHNNFSSGAADSPHDRRRGTASLLDLTTGDIDNVEVHIATSASSEGIEVELSFAADFPAGLAQRLTTQLREALLGLYSNADGEVQTIKAALGNASGTPERADSIVGATSALPKTAERVDQVGGVASQVLRTAWEEVLGSADTSLSFFEQGGDLVSAGLLAAHMEVQGYELCIEDIIRNPSWEAQLVSLVKI